MSCLPVRRSPRPIALPAASGVVVPRTAFTDATESQLFVIRDGVAELLAVRRGAEDAQNALVSGLAEGSVFVLDGTGAVSDGLHVAVHR